MNTRSLHGVQNFAGGSAKEIVVETEVIVAWDSDDVFNQSVDY
jgi:hypothetical protein